MAIVCPRAKLHGTDLFVKGEVFHEDFALGFYDGWSEPGCVSGVGEDDLGVDQFVQTSNAKIRGGTENRKKPRDRNLSGQPISSQIAQSRKKKPTYLCAPRTFINKMLVIFNNNKILLC